MALGLALVASSCVFSKSLRPGFCFHQYRSTSPFPYVRFGVRGLGFGVWRLALRGGVLIITHARARPLPWERRGGVI
ncbi:hypothetical protein T484DRAFT_3623945 [Baffinella frigidus]|nr:hypothetical protein T484DRAFT_3623945 [Cryptophyta sp. CCMP2293]